MPGAMIDLASLGEDRRMAYYGALLAMAAADGSVDPTERELFGAVLDTEGLSEASKERLETWVKTPPDFASALEALAGARDDLRYGVLTGLCDMALADGIVEEDEEQALEVAAKQLGVREGASQSILSFLGELLHVLSHGDDDEEARAKVECAARHLADAHVPVVCAYFSTTVTTLRTRLPGAWSKLGLELGFVPGVGISILAGTGVRVCMTELTESGVTLSARQRRRRDVQRIALLELEDTINDVIRKAERLRRLDEVEHAGEIRDLEEREAALRQLMATRRSALEHAE